MTGIIVLDTNTSAGLAVSDPDTLRAPLAEWTSGKKQASAHTQTALSSSPASVRLAAARDADFKALKSGRYVEFVRDVVCRMPQNHVKALALAAARAMGTHAATKLGDFTCTVTVTAADIKSAARASKATMLVLAQFLTAPTAVVKNIEAPKPLPKSLSGYVALASDWLAWNAADEAARAAAKAARESASCALEVEAVEEALTV